MYKIVTSTVKALVKLDCLSKDDYESISHAGLVSGETVIKRWPRWTVCIEIRLSAYVWRCFPVSI